MNVPRLDLSGSYHDFGLAHGRAFRDVIRDYAFERLQIAGEPGWVGRSVGRAELLSLAEECAVHHEEFSPSLMEELAGMAKAVDLTVAELVISGGFTDFIDVVVAAGGSRSAEHVEPGRLDDCTAFLVPGARMTDGAAAFGQTWDMHEGSAEHVVLLRGRPGDGPAFQIFTTAGAVGMIGMNEVGLSVGITNLMAADGRPGVTWPFVVREMLKEETLAAALAVLERAPLAGGHNYLVMDASGAGANVEAMPTVRRVTSLERVAVVHTNHCQAPETIAVQRPKEPESQLNSEARLADARRLLDRSELSVEDLMDVTADTANICRVGIEPLFVGTCGAVITVPATREMWVVPGRPSERPYERVVVGGANATAGQAADAGAPEAVTA